MKPSGPINLTPLSVQGLWLAETTMPPIAPSSVTRKATAGVGTTPAERTSAPAEWTAAASQPVISSRLSRVSPPRTSSGRAPAGASAGGSASMLRRANQ